MFRIGEFAKMGQVTIKTLRYYDEIELLKPQEIDVMTNYRYYTTKQLVQLHEIQFYRQIGCSIQDIKKIIAGENETEILMSKCQETLNEISRLKQQVKQINYRIESERIMEYKAIIKEIPAYTIYAKKMTVSNYADYAKVIPEIGEAMMEVNPDLKCVTPEYCYISYLGETGDDVNWEIEYCEAVEKIGVAPEGIEFRRTEPITVVSVMHKGSYAGLRLAFIFATNWAMENGYKMCGYPRESYIDGMWNFEDENEWLTEVQIPIVK